MLYTNQRHYYFDTKTSPTKQVLSHKAFLATTLQHPEQYCKDSVTHFACVQVEPDLLINSPQSQKQSVANTAPDARGHFKAMQWWQALLD